MGSTLQLHNARIWTGDARRPWAGGLTIVDGRVVSLDEPCDGAEVAIDAGGRTITPGLIDAHVHLLLGGQSLDQLDLSQVKSREEFEAAIARRHAELPADQWLIATTWSQENWGGQMPDKSWLAAAGDRPVVCHRMDLHAALVNDAVLSLCDLAEDPPGGRIVRDQETGKPTGLMVEAAAWEMVNPLVPEPDDEAKQDMVRAAQAHAHRLGLTAVGSMEYVRDVRRVYESMRDRLSLRCRFTLLDRAWPMSFDYARQFPGDDVLGVIGCKSFLDGTFGSRTARLFEDFSDDPGNRGLLVELAAEGRLGMWARAVAANGLSPSMHAIGDEAVRTALDVVHAIDQSVRPRIEHAQIIDPDDIARFHGVIASMQPLHKAYDAPVAAARLGPRASRLLPFRSLLDAGARLAFGSDWPVVSIDPLAGIRAAVTGLTIDGETIQPEQNLTVAEALLAYTAGAAHALRMDDAGALHPGDLGDFVLYDRDPFTADWADAPPRVVMTVVGGRVVYEQRAGEGSLRS